MTLAVNIRQFGGVGYMVTSNDLVNVTFGMAESGGPFAEHVEEIKPTPEQWAAFWSAVEACKTWGHEYVNQNILDGTEWEVELNHGDMQVRAMGLNAYPEGWPRFVDALRHLVDGRLYL